MPYQRVIPRDLFNEAKLLKCYGQLSLLIHDGLAGQLVMRQLVVMPTDGFQIEQDGLRNQLYCSNLILSLDGEQIHVATNYNSTAPYPMVAVLAGECELDVFNDDGSFSDEFKERFLDAKEPRWNAGYDNRGRS